jgi:hypothetical protein
MVFSLYFFEIRHTQTANYVFASNANQEHLSQYPLYTIPKIIIIEVDTRCNDAAVTKQGKKNIILLQFSNQNHIVAAIIQSMTNLKFHWSFDHGNQNKDKQKKWKRCKNCPLCIRRVVRTHSHHCLRRIDQRKSPAYTSR